MKILDARYIISAPSLKDCPDFQGRPEFVLVGRSNVGKSSFINCLTLRKNLARTSNTPGKTRYINYYEIDYSHRAGVKEQLLFVDLPGYGYAKISKSEQEKWRRHLEGFLTKREPIRQIWQLIDARHGPQDNDIQMYEWLQYHGRPVQVVLTKADKLSRNEVAQQVSNCAKALDLESQDIIPFSAEKQLGREQAWNQILDRLSVTASS